MQRYKNYPIHATAVCAEGGVWHGQGVVLDPQTRLISEIHRIETAKDLLFLSKQEAQEFALKLCKAWIGKAGLSKTM